MSNSSLTALSVLEAVLVVIVLSLAFIQISIRLRTISKGLQDVAAGVGAIDGHVSLIGPTVPKVNAPLEAIVGALPSLVTMAETLAEG